MTQAEHIDARGVDTESSIEVLYRDRTPGSARLAREAASCFPSGITHDSRHLKPYGIYVDHALGAHKWDVDGRRYVDYFGGHGALLLGHNHPEVLQAIHAALDKGSHFAAGQEAEIRWAQAVRQLVPSAERVRFTSSGTEATLMALRLARAFTGRRKILRFRGHFHGWHDDMTSGHATHFDGSPTPGVTAAVAANTVLLEAGDPDAVSALFAADPDIAAVILEPLGAATGQVPVDTAFLAALRELTAAHEVLLIFDEVVTGFRVSPGGVQAESGVTPDLTALAKILAGGLPGGAVVGREDILDRLDFEASRSRNQEKIYHPGTFNANPVSAAAGATALEVLSRSQACGHAADTARLLRDSLNQVLLDLDVPWAAYGTSSAFHLFLNPAGRKIDPADFDPAVLSREELQGNPPEEVRKLRLAMLVNGIDLSGWPGGLTSLAHGPEDVQATADAFRESLLMLRREAFL